MIKTELPGFVNSFEQQFATAAAFIETVQDQLSKADERDDRYFKEIELLKAENAQLKTQLSNNDNEPEEPDSVTENNDDDPYFEQQDDIDLGDGDGDTPFSNCESEQPKLEEPIAQPEPEIPVEQLPKTPIKTSSEQPATVIPVKFNEEQLAKIFAPRDFSATGHINPEPEIARLKAEWSAAVETAGKAITMFNVDIDTFIYMVTWSFQTKIHDIKIKDGDVWIKGTAKSRLNMLYTGQTGWFKVIPAEHKKNFIAADFLSVWDAKVSMGF